MISRTLRSAVHGALVSARSHGAVASRSARAFAGGPPACLMLGRKDHSRSFSGSAEGAPAYLILGGNSSIGASLAEKLLVDGSRVAVCCRNDAKMTELVEMLCAGPAGAGAKERIMSVNVDATVPAEVEACVKNVLGVFGRVDGAVNCVGSIVLKPAHSTSEAEFEETLKTNLFSSFSLLRNLARPMMKQKSGSIVFCSSAVASIGLSNHEAIAAAKAGVEGLALSAAATYARYGIRVNVVAPGLTNTKLAQKITSNEAALKSSVAMHPLGRIGEAEESASAIYFLLKHNYITGQVLGVDGGLSSLK